MDEEGGGIVSGSQKEREVVERNEKQDATPNNDQRLSWPETVALLGAMATIVAVVWILWG